MKTNATATTATTAATTEAVVYDTMHIFIVGRHSHAHKHTYIHTLHIKLNVN